MKYPNRKTLRIYFIPDLNVKLYLFIFVQIKLKEAENEDTIKLLSGRICESEMVNI